LLLGERFPRPPPPTHRRVRHGTCGPAVGAAGRTPRLSRLLSPSDSVRRLPTAALSTSEPTPRLSGRTRNVHVVSATRPPAATHQRRRARTTVVAVGRGHGLSTAAPRVVPRSGRLRPALRRAARATGSAATERRAPRTARGCGRRFAVNQVSAPPPLLQQRHRGTGPCAAVDLGCPNSPSPLARLGGAVDPLLTSTRVTVLRCPMPMTLGEGCSPYLQIPLIRALPCLHRLCFSNSAGSLFFCT
jgi:hypothetical protein